MKHIWIYIFLICQGVIVTIFLIIFYMYLFISVEWSSIENYKLHQENQLIESSWISDALTFQKTFENFCKLFSSLFLILCMPLSSSYNHPYRWKGLLTSGPEFLCIFIANKWWLLRKILDHSSALIMMYLIIRYDFPLEVLIHFFASSWNTIMNVRY